MPEVIAKSSGFDKLIKFESASSSDKCILREMIQSKKKEERERCFKNQNAKSFDILRD
jgi:hypothetical protein